MVSGQSVCHKTHNRHLYPFVATNTSICAVPPKFRKRPRNAYAHTKGDVQFECDVHAVPAPMVRWIKNGDVVIPSEYFQIVDGYNLRILGLLNTDDGMYQCFAQNDVGNTQASAQLIITQPGRWSYWWDSWRNGIFCRFRETFSLSNCECRKPRIYRFDPERGCKDHNLIVCFASSRICHRNDDDRLSVLKFGSCDMNNTMTLPLHCNLNAATRSS